MSGWDEVSLIKEFDRLGSWLLLLLLLLPLLRPGSCRLSESECSIPGLTRPPLMLGPEVTEVVVMVMVMLGSLWPPGPGMDPGAGA